MVGIIGLTKGPSIEYVTLFLANFYPLPPVTLRHTSRDPPKVYVTQLEPAPRFVETRTKALLYKFCFNWSRGFGTGGFCQGVFCLEGFVWGGFCLFPFCQNTSVTSGSLTSL